MTPGTSLKTKIIAVGGRPQFVPELGFVSHACNKATSNRRLDERQRAVNFPKIIITFFRDVIRNGKRFYQRRVPFEFRRERFSRLGLTYIFYSLFSNTVWLKQINMSRSSSLFPHVRFTARIEHIFLVQNSPLISASPLNGIAQHRYFDRKNNL